MGLYAVAVALVPLWSSSPPPCPSLAESAPEFGSTPWASSDEAAAEEPSERERLRGIWWRYESGGEGERVRFYYFHGDGTGLYRYGRVGLTNTHSFDYDVRGDVLVLDFRKTGEHHEVPFTLEAAPHRGERDWLELRDDPEDAGTTRYFRESDDPGGPSDQGIDDGYGAEAADGSAPLGPPPAGHMWIDFQRYATGGQGFLMYQLRPAGIDGRGVGWFHRGDFNDWSTEAMTYRIVGDRIELRFTLEDRLQTTAFVVDTDEEGVRWLHLEDDPRDFWHAHRYRDMGPSFGAALAPLAVRAAAAER